MNQRQQIELADIRQRSAELWRLHALPAIDPETGHPKPFVIVSPAHEDVRFLLARLTEALDDVSRLEDMIDEDESELDDERLEDERTESSDTD